MSALKVLVVPDKFKGTLSAAQAAEAIAAGWRRARPQDTLELLPMSDGGDGFGAVIGKLLGARLQMVRTADAAHRSCQGSWWWEPGSGMAVIETAAVIGLAMLPRGRYHPFALDTAGVGKVVRAASQRGASRTIVGVGGSATNDGGFGLARDLGWEFWDSKGRLITEWTELDRLSCIKRPLKSHWFKQLTVAVDVQNPLLGPRGASRVYGPQKGLRSEDFAKAELCLKRLAQVVKGELGLDLARVAGSGAAGGLGFGLQAFLGAEVTGGFELFAKLAQLDRRLREAECVITGEGAIDRSTLMGKGVSQVAERCKGKRVPCIGLGGTVDRSARGLGVFTQVHGLTELTDVEEAKAHPARWLRRLAARIAKQF